ncbi:MAG TPA: protein translocase subunit SecF [Candidatus Acidoferrales bacterium]|jgi:preprotein translocase subunit SecF|nr:protein translocase subunit SecF [Candidatus Acidoferrales bacterium]
MEFFHHDVNFDWMGKTKYFVALSLTLLIIGTASWIHKGSLDYGIDFKGGTLVYVRFASTPPIDKLRQGLVQQGLGDSVIQQISDIATPNANELVIYLPQRGQGNEALDAGKSEILNALQATLGAGSAEAGKQDFNEASADMLADVLARKDPLSLGATGATRYQQLAKQLVDYRDKTARGVISNLNDLSQAGATPAVVSALRDSFYTGPFAVVNVEIVGPKVGADLRRQAVYVTLYALAGMLVYIALRFEFVYGAAAVLAVFHDVLITLGLFSLLHFEISLTVIAALLTLVGYSMNDTIVIFDRIRENLRLMRREPFKVIVNRSINQTLSRTILTSGLTFLTVLVLFLLGGQVLRSFSFALVVGILVGTYSSFGIAAPLVVAWNHWRGHGAVPVSGTTASSKTRAGEAQGRLAPAGRR